MTALVGDNGAGKSTLIKTISGIWEPDAGEILWEGKPVHLHSPKDADALGITTIYQDLALCDNLDIVQNMFLGHEEPPARLLDESAWSWQARQTLADLHVTTVRSIRQPVASLSGGQRQSVAVAKAVMQAAKLVIMDEPTAALGVAQTKMVLELIKRLSEPGHRGPGHLAQPQRRLRAWRTGSPCSTWAGWPRSPRSSNSTRRHRRTHDHRPVGPDPPPGRRSGSGRAARRGGIVSTETHQPSPELPESASPGDQAAAEVATAAPDVLANSLGEYLRIQLRRIRSGESGALPVVIGLVAIVIYFQVRNSLFLSPGNLVNLLIQGAPYIILGMAEVFVLLLGEIDLAVGFTGAVAAVITAWTVFSLPWWIAIILGLGTGAFLGLVFGLLITRLGLPSFVVTLAGLLGLQGLMIVLVARSGHGPGGSIPINNKIIGDLTEGNLSPAAGWIVMVVVVVLAAVVLVMRDRQRRAAGLVTPPISVTALKIAVMAVAGVVVVLIGNADRGTALQALRGVPWVTLIVLGVLGIWTFLLGRTRFGRYIYAIGGNAEAARRAGVNLSRIRTGAFVLTGVTGASPASSWPPGWGRSPPTSTAASWCCSPWRRRSSAVPTCSAGTARC